MYKRILLASDGSRETLVALREGALIARTFGARAHLLIIERGSPGTASGDGVCLVYPPSDAPDLLALGLRRLERLGVPATGEILRGEGAQIIARAAVRVRADLVIVRHRRQSFLKRWWTGPSGAYIIDQMPCSLMIARPTISDEEFGAHLGDDAAVS